MIVMPLYISHVIENDKVMGEAGEEQWGIHYSQIDIFAYSSLCEKRDMSTISVTSSTIHTLEYFLNLTIYFLVSSISIFTCFEGGGGAMQLH